MREKTISLVRWAMLALVLVVVPGCLAAAAGAAGAGAGIYLTSQGAGSMVDAPMATVAQSVPQVFGELGIQLTQTEAEVAEKREFTGTKDGMDIRVKLEPEGAGMTDVSVSARKNQVEWDKSYAQMVLERIVSRH